MENKIEFLKQFAQEVENNIDEIEAESSQEAKEILEKLIKMHPAETATVLDNVSEKYLLKVFEKFCLKKSYLVFDKLSEEVQAYLLPLFGNDLLLEIFKNTPSDRLTTIFEQISNEDLSRYLRMTQKKRRQKIISSLKSEDQTAGRMLNSDVLTLHKELTVKKVVSLMQQIGTNFEILPRQYVVDAEMQLTGFIEITDLLKNDPCTKVEKIMKKIDVKANVDDDQEVVAEIVKRYDLLSIPVVDAQDHFLGIISANDVLEVIEKEVTEDTYKMSGLSPVEHAYIQTNFLKIAFDRCKWLVPLLLFQSVSGFALSFFDNILSKYNLMYFLTMLIGTGGNVGNQSGTFVVRGLATGEINRKNKFYVFLRELFISIIIGLVLVLVSIGRVWFQNKSLPGVFATCTSLFFIVVTSVSLGTIIPIILDSWEIDPANSAAPFLATLMDVIGVVIFCVIASLILR